MVVTNFDQVTPYYDSLSQLVFGDQLLRAQLAFLGELGPGSSVLIVGGGTGSILNHMPVGLKCIHYVEPSGAMMKRAKSRVNDDNIIWHQLPFENFESSSRFDVILAPFYFDLYFTKQLGEIVVRIKHYLRPRGYLVATDFIQTGKVRHALLLRVMYLFFKLSAGVQPQSLPDWRTVVLQNGFELCSQKNRHSDLLSSCLFRNQDFS